MDQTIRKQLSRLLMGGNAHVPFQRAVADFPLEHSNDRGDNFPFTPWQLLEHMRIAQWDILEFIRNPKHESPKWPQGYWPSPSEQADEQKWENTLNHFRKDLQALMEMVNDENVDLYSPLPHAEGYTIFREILLVADHNAYHLGQFVLLRKLLGLWKQVSG